MEIYNQNLNKHKLEIEKILANNLIYVSFSHKFFLVKRYLTAVDRTFEKISDNLKKNFHI